MNCEKYKKLFSSYLDGDLSIVERRRFEDHLAECEGCAAEFAEFKKVVALAAKLPPIQPSLSFDASLKVKLAQGAEASESRSLLGGRTAIAFGTVFLLLVAFLGVYLYNNPGEKGRQSEDRGIPFMVGREVVPVVPSRANENIFTNFVMPSVPVMGGSESGSEEVDTGTLEDWQEGRSFVLPIIINERQEQDKPEINYVIRRVSLIGTAGETGL